MSTISSGTTLTTALVQTGDTTGDLVIKTNNGNTTAVTFNTAGAIGVGSSPSYGSVGQYLQSAGNAAPATWATIASSQWTSNSTAIYYNTGNVGIGTASPSKPLDVQGTGDIAIRSKSNGSGGAGLFIADGNGSGSYPGLQLAQSGTNYWSLDMRGDTNLHFFREAGSGNVIIDAGSIMNGSGRPILNQTGSVLQVVSTTKTDTFSMLGDTYTTITGLSASITPSSTSSKILIIVGMTCGISSDGVIFTRLMRNSTAIDIGDAAGSRTQATTATYTGGSASIVYQLLPQNMNFLDSPATTSSTTYSVQFKGENGSTTVYLNRASNDLDASGRARLASTITLMEIAA